VPARLPWRTSLRVRLLATSVLIALCSIAATAWLAVHTTTEAIQQQQQGQGLSGGASIYDTLLDYAATHSSWAGVRQTVRDLAARSGRRITLTTQDRQPITASGTGASSLPQQASAAVNPLQVDEALTPTSGTAGIDPAAVGPFLLSKQERTRLLDQARKAVGCLRSAGFGPAIDVSPSGRPAIEMTGNDYKPTWFLICGVPQLSQPTATEEKALAHLNALVNDCLGRVHLGQVQLNVDFTWFGKEAPDEDQAVQSCIDASRRQQLGPYVAPPALLFITSPAGSVPVGFQLSTANRTRIVGVTAVVLALTVAVTIVTSARMIKPLRTLTRAVQHPGEPYARVPVTTSDEIGRLTSAFNDLTERRERTEEHRTAMVSDIAHELRTPLSNIRGWLEAVEDGIATSDRAMTSSLLEEAMLLQHIIDDLQVLAAADAGQLRLRAEPVQVRDILGQVVVAHLAAAETAGVALSARTEGDPELDADPVRLRQAIGNLVSNAIRHTPPGGSVTIACYPAGKQIMIDVADTGTGISPEDLPWIFDRFWRADKSRNRRTGGSGLGLPIARQLIAAHGGTITAASVPGEGTVFTTWLPASPG